jgi:hypothetical protein
LANSGVLSELGLHSSYGLLAISRDLVPWFITLIGVKPAGKLTDLQCSLACIFMDNRQTVHAAIMDFINKSIIFSLVEVEY